MGEVIIMPRTRVEDTFTIRIHKPLWGGFPKHWAKGPAAAFKLTDDVSKAYKYDDADAEAIERKLHADYPGAIVARNAL